MYRTMSALALTLSFALPAAGVAMQQSTPSSTPTVVPAFPPSAKCTTNKPCQSVTGEVLRIEESYWIRDANGQEIQLRVTGDSRMKELPKVGDSVAAQLTSTGDVEALIKLQQIPRAPEASVPGQTHSDLR